MVGIIGQQNKLLPESMMTELISSVRRYHVTISDLILTSGLNGLNWRLPIGWRYPSGHMTKRHGCQGQFEPDSRGVQLIFSLNMFYNLRRSSPKAYAIMHKRGFISPTSVAEVEEPGSDSPHDNTTLAVEKCVCSAC